MPPQAGVWRVAGHLPVLGPQGEEERLGGAVETEPIAGVARAVATDAVRDGDLRAHGVGGGGVGVVEDLLHRPDGDPVVLVRAADEARLAVAVLGDAGAGGDAGRVGAGVGDEHEGARHVGADADAEPGVGDVGVHVEVQVAGGGDRVEREDEDGAGVGIIGEGERGFEGGGGGVVGEIRLFGQGVVRVEGDAGRGGGGGSKEEEADGGPEDDTQGQHCRPRTVVGVVMLWRNRCSVEDDDDDDWEKEQQQQEEEEEEEEEEEK